MSLFPLALERVSRRFWSKVDRSRGPDDCWPWTAFVHLGYGKFGVAGRVVGAHRMAYLLANGSIPEGLFVLHAPVICHNRACCNPAHLRVGTARDNYQDAIKDGTVSPAIAGPLSSPWDRPWRAFS